MPEGDLKLDPRIGPFVTALLCERILEERDGVKTAVRIIDQLNRGAIGAPPPAVMEPFQQNLGLLIRLKAGIARGTQQVKTEIRNPSNEVIVTLNHPAPLAGPEDAGFDLVFNLMLEINQAGTWWFDIYIGQERWTRVPLRVVYLPQHVNVGQGHQAGH